MVRLTEKSKTGLWAPERYKLGAASDIGHKITKTVSEKIYGALCKLKDYEDSGMNPDQAAKAAEKNTPTEPKEMQDWNGITAYECENCGCDVFETQNYCPYCGQRLKWEE